MAERVNIARIAEIVSSDIFSKLGWTLHGTPNESWKCVDSTHEKADHPTDATFVYDDPYTDKCIHVLTDLKSYNAKSVDSFDLKDTVESLASAVDCAKDNPNWKKIYLKAGKPYEVQGLLFIYNHDAEYDKSFAERMHSALQGPLKIPEGVRISILSPDEIWYINELLVDHATLARDGIIPLQPEDLSFYYPSHSRKKMASRDHSEVATLDMLKGKYQLLKYTLPSQQGGSIRGMLVYYRGPGRNEREFIVLIDMLRTIGALDSCDVIHVRCARADKDAANTFSKAIIQYADFPDQTIPEKLKKLKYGSVSEVRPRVTNFEVVLRGQNA